METITYQLEDFEGPLDLLLFLITKNKKNIYEIDIVSLIDQYVAVMQQTNAYSLDTASEFIDMAARLVQMKSFFLLPKSVEAERMREELTGLLVEYNTCKRVAEQFKTMAEGVFIAVRKPTEIELDNTYKIQHEPQELATAYMSLMGRSSKKKQPRQEQFEPLVQTPFVSVTSRIVHVLRGLVTGKIKQLAQLFDKGAQRSQTVATFLAVLELMRAGRIEIGEDESLVVSKKRKRASEEI